jgi:hypothetical protein
MKDQTIATWNNYAIVRTTPTFGGRPFYSISRDGKCCSRTFNQKKQALKALRSLQSIQPYPILDARIQWLREGIDKHGHCAQ